MSHVSYTAEGFRAAYRRPLLTLAEIAWRWSVGATAAALSVFALLEYLASVPVTNRELLFLRTRQPALIGSAMAHMLRGTLDRIILAGLLASLALVGLWIVAASIGRGLEVLQLLDYFTSRRRDAGAAAVALVESAASGDVESNVSAGAFSKFALRVLVRLNFLRSALALAAICGFLGAAILAGFASPEADPQPTLAFFIFLPLAGSVGLLWWVLNWLLSLGTLFAVRDGEDAVGAISAAIDLCRERTGPVFAVSTWTGLAHFGVFVGLATIVSMFLGLAAVVPWRLVVAGIMLVTLGYFALTDWISVARLAGYVSILEMPDVLVSPAPIPPSPSCDGSIDRGPTTIDFGELILSDVPTPVLET